MKFKLIGIITLYILVIFSCSDNNYLSQNNKKIHDKLIKIDDLTDQQSCVIVFHQANENVMDTSMINLGVIHNRLLSHLERKINIEDRCERSEYRIKLDLMDDAIKQNGDYVQTFDSTYHSSIEQIYFDFILPCNGESANERLSSILSIELFDSLNVLSNQELVLLDSFFHEVLRTPLGLNVYDYAVEILDNEDEFFDGGKMSLALLSIYEYSSCYWSSKARSRWGLLAALSDLAGAAWGAAKNIYRNREHYNSGCGPCADRDILNEMGHGAASASIPIVGGDLYDWVTGN